MGGNNNSFLPKKIKNIELIVVILCCAIGFGYFQWKIKKMDDIIRNSDMEKLTQSIHELNRTVNDLRNELNICRHNITMTRSNIKTKGKMLRKSIKDAKNELNVLMNELKTDTHNKLEAYKTESNNKIIDYVTEIKEAVEENKDFNIQLARLVVKQGKSLEDVNDILEDTNAGDNKQERESWTCRNLGLGCKQNAKNEDTTETASESGSVKHNKKKSKKYNKNTKTNKKNNQRKNDLSTMNKDEKPGRRVIFGETQETFKRSGLNKFAKSTTKYLKEDLKIKLDEFGTEMTENDLNEWGNNLENGIKTMKEIQTYDYEFISIDRRSFTGEIKILMKPTKNGRITVKIMYSFDLET